jgi:hypothetical protein
MGIVRFETDDDVLELSVVTGKRAKAFVEAVRVAQRLPIVVCGGRPNKGPLQIGIDAARHL